MLTYSCLLISLSISKPSRGTNSEASRIIPSRTLNAFFINLRFISSRYFISNLCTKSSRYFKSILCSFSNRFPFSNL